jgi:alkylated DNA repair dioxygenase AlkB
MSYETFLSRRHFFLGDISFSETFLRRHFFFFRLDSDTIQQHTTHTHLPIYTLPMIDTQKAVITTVGPDAQFIYIPDVVSNIVAEKINALYTHVAAKAPLYGEMFGKQYAFPRTMAMYGKDYPFSGQTVFAEEESDEVVDACIASAKEMFGDGYNAALVNVYKNGDQYISQHRDNEPLHRKGAEICTFSFGATRKMTIRSMEPIATTTTANNKRRRTFANWHFPLEGGSCAIMSGARFQDDFSHGIPKTKCEDWRMSVTVREFPD